MLNSSCIKESILTEEARRAKYISRFLLKIFTFLRFFSISFTSASNVAKT